MTQWFAHNDTLRTTIINYNILFPVEAVAYSTSMYAKRSNINRIGYLTNIYRNNDENSSFSVRSVYLRANEDISGTQVTKDISMAHTGFWGSTLYIGY